ncbi:hypothetical protein [Shimazuella kribbensis]|uniref:hypothetical protein n=1 Tax=Shimazuella kribbensis TaxID=139808 RepID=UPI00048DB521|nr:hypothetical protein [Shimazuella kribbensis]
MQFLIVETDEAIKVIFVEGSKLIAREIVGFNTYLVRDPMGEGRHRDVWMNLTPFKGAQLDLTELGVSLDATSGQFVLQNVSKNVFENDKVLLWTVPEGMINPPFIRADDGMDFLLDTSSLRQAGVKPITLMSI